MHAFFLSALHVGTSPGSSLVARSNEKQLLHTNEIHIRKRPLSHSQTASAADILAISNKAELEDGHSRRLSCDLAGTDFKWTLPSPELAP